MGDLDQRIQMQTHQIGNEQEGTTTAGGKRTGSQRHLADVGNGFDGGTGTLGAGALRARGLAGHYRGLAQALPARAAVAGTDRKSTRLNSSHLGISYAVFCLKKKD